MGFRSGQKRLNCTDAPPQRVQLFSCRVEPAERRQPDFGGARHDHAGVGAVDGGRNLMQGGVLFVGARYRGLDPPDGPASEGRGPMTLVSGVLVRSWIAAALECGRGAVCGRWSR
jgi:hypothetical protein